MLTIAGIIVCRCVLDHLAPTAKGGAALEQNHRVLNYETTSIFISTYVLEPHLLPLIEVNPYYPGLLFLSY